MAWRCVVVILTNVNKDEAPKELQELNVADYVVKAYFTPQQVLDLVQKVLEHKAKA